ncbi:FGFR1 oncogene partner 2 -like [Asbolus verrucosus]|uniref:FGFR1 oncogene partner 2-like n=1 Tax=Asbolus verrucosus TaxID=1661398 RepID=A0A482VZN4_ASBVE|nr:FGFR1 oncogene partner 2 -like [Asbolus verrucosus]
MSLTIQQIITDAKRLAGRLKERDTIADTLLNETNAITKKIDAMKQFQEEVDQLNEVANQKPHSQLIANIQKENRHLREIQQENRELRAALEDYQTTLEHIMTKYREHTTDEIYKTKLDFKSFQSKQYDEIIQQQAEKIQEMAAVMKKAALIDENSMVYNEEIIAMLKAENQGLREMLGIAFKHGSLINNKMEDKTIQTETCT